MPVRRSRYAREAPAAVTVAQTVDISSPCDHGYEAGFRSAAGPQPGTFHTHRHGARGTANPIR